MKKAIGPNVFIPDFGGTGTRAGYTRKTAQDLGLHEDWYRDAIYANPALVIDPCRQGGLVTQEEKWMPWAKEFASGDGPMDAGPMDVLLLSSTGRVGIVETKLSYNPQRRREVVAQILDYALAFQEAESLPPWPTSPNAPDEADVRERMTRGDFLLVVAGDEIDPRALRLGEAVLAGHLTSEWDLAMVDLNVFEAPPATAPFNIGVLTSEPKTFCRRFTELSFSPWSLATMSLASPALPFN